MIQVIVMTSDNQQDLVLSAFWYQWNKYFNNFYHNRVTCGFTHYDCDSHFRSIGNFSDYPANKWSDALIKVLDEVAEDVFILMLDDYWLTRSVDVNAIKMIYDYMYQFENVLKFDLTDERLYSGTPPGDGYNRFYWGHNTYDTLGHLDLIKSDPNSLYHMSLWGGMWRRDLLRQIIVPGEKAQEIEMHGGSRLLEHPEWLVLGTRQCPMRHANVIQRGKWSDYETTGLPSVKPNDLDELKNLGYLDTERLEHISD